MAKEAREIAAFLQELEGETAQTLAVKAGELASDLEAARIPQIVKKGIEW